MSDFFAELEEDIREERIYTLWNKYGNYIIGLALIIVFATAGYSLWDYLRKQNQRNAYISFSQGMDLMHQGKKEEAIKVFQNLAKEGGGDTGNWLNFTRPPFFPIQKPFIPDISRKSDRSGSEQSRKTLNCNAFPE